MPRSSNLPFAGFVAVAFACAAAVPAWAQNIQLDFGEGVAEFGDAVGRSIAVLRDVNGDGADDMVIGAPSVGVTGGAFVVSGLSGDVLFSVVGDAFGDFCGQAVANAGDVNLDGIDDVLVGLPGSDFNGEDTGRIRIYSGATGLLLITRIGPAPGSDFGSAVAGVGDLNGDGRAEFLVGAPGYEPPGSGSDSAGYASLHDGLFGGVLKTWVGNQASALLGAEVAGLGDISGDGVPDFAIATPRHDVLVPPLINLPVAGRIDVYSGASKALLWTRYGGVNHELGRSIHALSDLNGNGVREVLVGAPGLDGRALLFDGTGTLLHTFESEELTVNDRFGWAVTSLGDIDRDGHDDIAVGAPAPLSDLPGYVMAYSGADFAPFGGPIEGLVAGDQFGYALAGGLDLNDDGWPDVAVGAPAADIEGSLSGQVLVLNLLTYQDDLGFGGPGNAELLMYGTPLWTGGQADLKLQGAKPSAPAWLLASPFADSLPFKGGVLVPKIATGLLVPVATDATGGLLIPGIPGGGGFLFVFVQALIQSAAPPLGWELSNAIVVELLP